MNIQVEIDAKGLVNNLVHYMTKEELIDFIKSIDLRVAEYDFTKLLKDYFVKEIEKEDILGDKD